MTMLAAALGPAELFVGASSAEVVVVASDQRQASIMLRYARPMVELNPVLAQRVQVYADRRYLPKNDATLLPLPDEPGALRGHDPSLQIVDELHVVTEEVREAVTSVAGKRPKSLTLAISTAASAPDSVMWCRKTNAGRSQDRRRRGRDRGRRPRGVASNTKPQESEEFCVTQVERPLEPL
jgi:phage terminase large subunit-like protein